MGQEGGRGKSFLEGPLEAGMHDLTTDGPELLGHMAEHGISSDVGSRAVGAPPGDIGQLATPVPALPFANHGVEMAGDGFVVLAADGRLPADFGLPTLVWFVAFDRQLMKGAARSPWMLGSVLEDARAVDDLGPPPSVAVLPQRVLEGFGMFKEVPGACMQLGDARPNVGDICLIRQVRAEGAAPKVEFRGRLGLGTRAASAVDAGPVAGQEGDIEQPGPVLVGVLQRKPFTLVGVSIWTCH